MTKIEEIKRKGTNITEFKVGQVVVRLEPCHERHLSYNNNLKVEVADKITIDNSWCGQPLEYLGIENNRIYLRDLTTPLEYIINFPIETGWEEGWGAYIDIAGVLKK